MGRPKTVNEQYCDRLKELVSHSPREYGYPFQRWTAQWLGKHLAKELGVGQHLAQTQLLHPKYLDYKGLHVESQI